MGFTSILAASSTSSPHAYLSVQAEPRRIPLRFLHAKLLCASGLPHKALVLRWVSDSCKTYIVKCLPIRADQQEAADLSAGAPGYANRRPSPLSRGGTLTGKKAAGKDPGLTVLGKAPAARSGSYHGPFRDARWKIGTWDLSKFTSPRGNVNWDAVIDAEVLRRKWLEEHPEASLNEDPIVFRMSAIPWWAWVRRFHLPEAELVNGRAAMVGFVLGYVVDGLTGMSLIDQTSSFVGKLLLLVTVLGVMLVRKNEDVENLKQVAHEWTFYDKQWQASRKDEQVPTSKGR